MKTKLLEEVIAHVIVLIGLNNHPHILHDLLRQVFRPVVIGCED